MFEPFSSVHFDLSMFPVIAAWLFDTGKKVFEMFRFDFMGYTLNGWVIMIGIAIFAMVCHFIGRILQ